MTDDPVGSNFTVTAADCITYYDNMQARPRRHHGCGRAGWPTD